jgi:hypothetical protein
METQGRAKMATPDHQELTASASVDKKTTPIVSGDAPQEQIAWDHALHEERVLNERSGLFLVAEAMMLVFYATMEPRASRLSLRLFAVAGILMSLMWTALSTRQYRDLQDATEDLQYVSPFYRDYRIQRKSQGAFRNADRPILVFGLPAVVCLVWIVLLLTGTRIMGL